MNKRSICIMSLLALLAFGLLIVGCSGGNDTAAEAEQAASATEAAPATEAPPAETAVATHDCEGGCGMKAVPEASMTEVGGKWLCGGCAKKAEAEAATEGHTEG